MYQAMLDAMASLPPVQSLVQQFRAEPKTLARLFGAMREAGVEERTSTSALGVLGGIAFIEDPTIRPTFIQGRNNEGQIIRLYCYWSDTLYEITGPAFDSYRGVMYVPRFDWSSL